MNFTFDLKQIIIFIIGAIFVFRIFCGIYYRYRVRHMRRQSSSGRTAAHRSSETSRSPAVPRSTEQRGSTRQVSVLQPTSGNLEQTDPVEYYANARHGSQDNWFRFQYRKVGNEWRSYILRMPDLKGRDSSLHRTHRYKNGNEFWVCYDPQPNNLKDAINISRAWADRELEYIATGIPFEEQVW